MRQTYIRAERLNGLLGNVVRAITIPPEIAEEIAMALRRAMHKPNNGSVVP